MSQSKMERLNKLLNDQQIITALAIDQRGALKKMMAEHKKEATREEISEFKILVAKELTSDTSSILLDPEFGLPATKQTDSACGLLLAYEKTGYDATVPGRLPDILDDWSVSRLKEAGADGIKFLLYYDVDESAAINLQKQIFIERIGSECQGEEMPFFLELLSYDSSGINQNSLEYAKIKPHKVNQMMKEFSRPNYHVAVLKVETPVNMNFVEGFNTKEMAYSSEEAAAYFRQQAEATNLPYIFLSAGVSADLFRETLHFAKASGSRFNGVLCGRATWAEGVSLFAKGGNVTQWLQTVGKNNVKHLNEVLKETATSIKF